jgi:hypothetical protein
MDESDPLPGFAVALVFLIVGLIAIRFPHHIQRVATKYTQGRRIPRLFQASFTETAEYVRAMKAMGWGFLLIGVLLFIFSGLVAIGGACPDSC